MEIIPPIDVTSANLVFSNIPEDDAAIWDNATTYDEADKVIFGKSLYESLQGGNAGNQPDESPDKWLLLGAINRYKAFDQKISDRATFDDEVIYTIAQAGTAVNSVAIFGLDATEVEIEVEDSIDGVVFSESYELIDNSDVVDWFSYYFSEVGRMREEILAVNIPPYANAETTITVKKPGNVAGVGQVVLGQAKPLGFTVFGTSLSIQDYSRKERDAFGNAAILKRGFARLVDFDAVIPTPDARRVQRVLAKYRASPVVWSGVPEERVGAFVYGYYRRFDIVLSNPSTSQVSIEVEGLV